MQLNLLAAGSPGSPSHAEGTREAPCASSKRTTNEPLASLQTCSVNLNSMCNFHTVQKHKIYLSDWRNPGPPHCRRGTGSSKPVDAVIHADRLGVEKICEPFA